MASGRRTALLEMVSNSAAVRAGHYRAQAARLRGMAEAEIIEHLRVRLFDLAERYDGLAAITDPGRADGR